VPAAEAQYLLEKKPRGSGVQTFEARPHAYLGLMLTERTPRVVEFDEAEVGRVEHAVGKVSSAVPYRTTRTKFRTTGNGSSQAQPSSSKANWA
jgi:hypothetical protein